MKKSILYSTMMAMALTGATVLAQDSLEEQIEASITDGLTWLVSQQNADGGWLGHERVARTCLALVKLEDRAGELGFDSPFDPGYEYSANVAAGWDYVFGGPYVYKQSPLAVQPAGDPDTNGNGYGLYFDYGGHRTYTTGICLMALVASDSPNRPNGAGLDFNGDSVEDTFSEIAQEAVDWLAYAQVDSGQTQGGWDYQAADNASWWADNSNSGYATLGLGYAQAGVAFGLTVPQWVKDELNVWVDYIQTDVTGGTNDGGSGYSGPNEWVNILKTGNLIYEMGLVGDDKATTRVQDAVDYIERHWSDADWCGDGWKGHRQAMYAMMKGLESMGIDELDTGAGPFDWFEEVATHLITTQNADGSWPDDCWGDQILSTTWALLTLEKSVPKFETPVPLDIKPGSCPNPINTGSKGVLPVAIAGTDELDVSQVDPETLMLVNLVDPDDPDLNVAPLRWAIENVATPYEPFVGKEVDAYACTEAGADGFMDLTMKFDTQQVVAALGEVEDGDVLVLKVIGKLKEEFGGTPIVGEDVVKILKKGKK